jgi:hypothetical protein
MYQYAESEFDHLLYHCDSCRLKINVNQFSHQQTNDF